MPPTREHSERIIAARARFHAQWWDDPRLGVSIDSWLEPHDPQIQIFAQEFERFAERVGDRLPAERRQIYERLIECGHRLNERYHSHCNMTVLHGDAHVWNVFLPRAGGGDVRLFDWDGWRIGVGTGDLAYMMALHWFPDHRRRYEGHLLTTTTPGSSRMGSPAMTDGHSMTTTAYRYCGRSRSRYGRRPTTSQRGYGSTTWSASF